MLKSATSLERDASVSGADEVVQPDASEESLAGAGSSHSHTSMRSHRPRQLKKRLSLDFTYEDWYQTYFADDVRTSADICHLSVNL